MRDLATNLLERRRLLLFAIAFVTSAAIHAPALSGPPIADDFAYLLNPWIRDPSPAHLGALLDPWSQATSSLKNYAPVRGLVHTLQWAVHPQVSIAYHLENVGLHALASVLLAVFLGSVGVPAAGALAAAAVFLVHPAAVEAVAWMSQVWSPLALAFSLLALLWLPRHPLPATVALALALLTKPMAVFAPPAAAVLAWSRIGRDDAPRRWGWIALWGVLVVLFSVAQVVAFGDSAPRPRMHEDPLVVARTMASFALRYLGMATTSIGVAAFQEPPLALSGFDPWWLASLLVLSLLAVRLAMTLRARSPEAAGWVWALAAFAPVSQVFPFLYPVADRYLYFMLPGLLLAVCIAGRDALDGIRDEAARARAGRVALAAASLLVVFFSWRSFERAALWQSEALLMADAARAFPDSTPALYLAARRAAREGDAEESARLLRAASDRGWDYWNVLLVSEDFAEVRGHPRFRSLVQDLAAKRIAEVGTRRRPTQMELSDLASAHGVRGEHEAAIAALDRALALGGPLDDELRARRNQLERGARAR